MQIRRQDQAGYTLIELTMSLAIAVLLLTALTGVVSSTLSVKDDTLARNDATRELRFAMERMVGAVRRSDRLLLPLADNPGTNWRENVREQSVPAGPPEGASALATAVLATTLGPSVDRDQDGWADANNDRDYFDRNKNAVRDAGEPERIDEDPGEDLTYDGESGIIDIDDDGDGVVDEDHVGGGGNGEDDDEDGAANEDGWNGLDDDGDGTTDEDPNKDANGDARAGIGGLDDDGDGAIDEGHEDDDDEDGDTDEDWFDPVVFFLSGTTLMERLPNLSPADGNDFSEYPIAENVTHFRVERVERVAGAGRRAVLVDITLQITPADGDPTSLNTRVRVGGGP